MTNNLTRLTKEMIPLLVPLIEEAGFIREASGSSGSGGSLLQHDLSGPFHSGTLADAQAPQFLLKNGSRSLTGNLAVVNGVTIDGVDLSAFKDAYDAHLLGDSHGVYAHAEGEGTRPAHIANRLNKNVNTNVGSGLLGGGTLTSDLSLSVNFAGATSPAVGLVAAIGTAAQAAREDHTHALDLTISPTWTGNHTWNNRTTHQGGIFLGFGDTLQFGGTDAVLYASGVDPDLLMIDNHLRVGGMLGVNTIPTAHLHVVGAGGTTLVKLEGTTGNYLVVDADANNMVRLGTSDFASGLRGWRVDGDGTAEFNNLFVRGELHATIFVADEMYATGGTAVFLTSSKVENPKTLGDNVLPGINGSFTLVVQASYATGFSYFAVDDVLRVKTMMQNGLGGLDIYDVYLQVTAVSSNGDRDIANGIAGTFDVTCIRRQGGSNSIVIPQGTAVVKWGEYNQGTDTFTGGVLITSDLNQAPYMDIFTVSSEGNEAWTQAPTPRVRVGLLDGITDPDLNPSGWGLWGNNVFLDGKIVAREGRILNNVIIGGGTATAQQVAGWGWGANTTYIDGNQIFTGTVNADKLNVGIGGGNLINGANWNDDPVGGALVMPGSWGRAFYGTVNYHRLTKDTTGSVTGTTGENYIEASVAASSGAGMQSESIYVDTTRTYTLSGFAKRLSGTGTTSIGLECYNSVGSLLGYRFPCLNAQAATLTSGFASSGGYRYHGTIGSTGAGHDTFIAGTTYVKVFFWIAESPSGSTAVAVWQLQFEEGNLLTSWTPGMRGNIQIDSSQIMAGTPGAQRTTMEATGVKGYNSSNVTQVHLDSSDGRFKAGAGKVEMGSDGFLLRTSVGDPAFFLFKDGATATTIGTMYAYKRTSPSTKTMGFLGVNRSTGSTPSELYLSADTNSATVAFVLDGGANSGAGEIQAQGVLRVTGTNATYLGGGLNVGSSTGAGTGEVKASGVGDFSAAGVRTRVTSSVPTGGTSGDLAIYESGGTRRLYANVNGTWRLVALT